MRELSLRVLVTDLHYVNKTSFALLFCNLFMSSSPEMQKNSEQAVTHCVLRVSQYELIGRQPEGHHGRGSMSQEALSSPRSSRGSGEKTEPAKLPQKEVCDHKALPPTKRRKSEKPPRGRHVCHALLVRFASV